MNQLIRLKRQKEDFELILQEVNEKENQERFKTLLREINLEATALLLKQIQHTTCSYYQLLKLHEYTDLLFWRQVVQDEKHFSLTYKAVIQRYQFLSQNSEHVRRLEYKLQNENLSQNDRTDIEDRLTAYKDHIRLSSMAMMQKIIPHHVNDPEKAVHVAQTSAVHEEFWFNSLTSKVQSSSEKTTNNSNMRMKSYVEYDNFNPKWEYLDFYCNLETIYKNFKENESEIALPRGADLNSLLSLLEKYLKEPERNLEVIINKEVQQTIRLLHSDPLFTRMVYCLKKCPSISEEISMNTSEKKEATETMSIGKNNFYLVSDSERAAYQNVLAQVRQCINHYHESMPNDIFQKLDLLSMSVNQFISQNHEKEGVMLINEGIIEAFNLLVKYSELIELKKLREDILKLPMVDKEEIISLDSTANKFIFWSLSNV